MISNKRYRVTKQFYKFLNDYTKTVVDIGGTLRKKQCNKINEIITTPLTWNKSKVCNSIFATLPNSIVNYYEPFLGSGSILLHVLQQQSEGKITIKSNIFASDFNKDLINFFIVLQQTPIELCSIFTNSFVSLYNNLENDEAKKKFYYDVRSDFNLNLGVFNLEQSARFLFLNKTSFGGLFRVNSKGFFNVPFGHRKKPKFPKESLLLEVHKLIKNVHFSHQKFNHQIALQKGDFFYLDPPYAKVTKTSFVNYLPDGFSNNDCLLLLEFCKRLEKEACFFTLSNSVELFNFGENYKMLQYTSNSLKGQLDQLLITNTNEQLNW
uniref:site-specific DNA-methyltransferase (adenine-specific) n=2 Tax=Emiliania huxleyi TaxID=2903 RepID=H9LTM3_EMIHU|nr:DNA adenine methylase [Emiliania huxleyi]UPY84876.1 DNA adenine methylase [Emiliania huxleyi]UPY84979.1 DNA adenine methylase [Emiliania huxleyi]